MKNFSFSSKGSHEIDIKFVLAAFEGAEIYQDGILVETFIWSLN